jgi:hypothetical protein
VRVAVGTPFVSWVALGWGEPVIPWWGSSRFVGPWWAGWGGPRVVNNVVVNRTTVVNVQNITVYRNVEVHNAVVSVRQDAFGRRGAREARVTDVDVRRLEPVRGRLHVTPDASSFVAGRGPAVKPPAQIAHGAGDHRTRAADRAGTEAGGDDDTAARALRHQSRRARARFDAAALRESDRATRRGAARPVVSFRAAR